jgi:hypothetical protein
MLCGLPGPGKQSHLEHGVQQTSVLGMTGMLVCGGTENDGGQRPAHMISTMLHPWGTAWSPANTS